jgi:hypothetical protein
MSSRRLNSDKNISCCVNVSRGIKFRVTLYRISREISVFECSARRQRRYNTHGARVWDQYGAYLTSRALHTGLAEQVHERYERGNFPSCDPCSEAVTSVRDGLLFSSGAQSYATALSVTRPCSRRYSGY